MFIAGMLLNYYLIFPFTFRFLGTYQVDSSVSNMITLSSYVDTMMMMTVLLGVIFELPWCAGCWANSDFCQLQSCAVTVVTP